MQAIVEFFWLFRFNQLHGSFRKRGALDGRTIRTPFRPALYPGFYVLICWTPEVLRKCEAALGGIVKRYARCSTGIAAVRVFSESENIGWEGPVPCDKLDELYRPVMISKSYLIYDFMRGVAINAIIPTPCHLPSARCLRSCFALLLASLASSSAFSFPRCPTWALIQPSLML
ncbi:hypothetical protein AVEN_234922-1 [Araneus ventricosus]|uniref:Uncharacterized protein n=1 Tax=Araneus ventricosus TaxID=182803 RepID=A0A4Y2JVK3_ARAVE|nr:hypothetical protein AVEN_234922-1 [Araneus ventricosus]